MVRSDAFAMASSMLPVALGSLSSNLAIAENVVSQNFAVAQYEELGCYKDYQRGRIFTEVTKFLDELTETSCAAICEDFPYFGLQYGSECWCADYTSAINRYIESNDCDMMCTGDSKANCGGCYAMRIFTRTTTDDDAIGCYGDSSTSRVFSDMIVNTSGMIPEVCFEHCNSKDALYYGTQWGEECWCGYDEDVNGRIESATCDRPCSGDSTLFCGGTYAMTVYGIDDNTTEGLPGGSPMPVSSSSPVTTTPDEHSTEDLPSPVPRAVPIGSPMPVPSFSPVTTTPVEHSAVPSVSPMPVSSPTPVMTISAECTGTSSAIRWASGTGFNGRMYLEGGGCGTMTDLYKSRVEKDGWTPKGPIYILDDNDDKMYSPTNVTGKWLLASDLYVRTGSIFYCRGTSIGGDCDELRIQSTNSTDFHEVRGHGGSLYFEKTLVTSWDTPKKSPQEIYEGGRSFLNCVSEYESNVTCDGQPKNDYGECRMDIIDSEMGYLGWLDSESYGLTWKVRGYCVDGSNPEVFDTTNVYGDIKNSDIHHMYYGMYSYGHQGGVWTNNKMHDNHQYGFDPHDDSDYLTIANNEVYDNVNHGIIASKRCNNVKIYENEVYNGGAQAAGIFLHRSSDSCEVYDNVVYDMQDAGIAIMESFDADIHSNTFTNVKYGIRISLGGGNNAVHDNVFENCSTYGLYTYQGSDAPDASSDGRPGENSFYDNIISNTETGVKIKNADNTIITGNTFTGTSLFEFSKATGTTWSVNTFEDVDDDLCYKNFDSSSFAYTDILPPLC